MGYGVKRASVLFVGLLIPLGCKHGGTSGDEGEDYAREEALAKSSPMIAQDAATMQAANVGMLAIPGLDEQGEESLAVSKLDVEVFLDGRMARTTVEQVFYNHTDRQTEGTYSFALPEGASLSRLAMDVEGKMVEGELVEREKARMIYEGIVHQKKDPALVEWTGNNRFSTQLFPIPAKGTKTVIISYEQLLPAHHGELTYHYALPRLEGDRATRIEDFHFKLVSEDGLALAEKTYGAKITQRSPGGQVDYSAKGFVPGGNISVHARLPTPDEVRIALARKKGTPFFLADVPIRLPEVRKDRIAKHLVLALDTSAGLGQRTLDRSVNTARALIETSPSSTRFSMISGDLDIRSCGEGLDKKRALACLEGLTSGGASDLGGLLTAAIKSAKRGKSAARVIVFSDGVASIGEMDGGLIRARVEADFKDSSHSLHMVAIGNAPNEDGARELARAGKGLLVRQPPTEDANVTAMAIHRAIRASLLEDVVVTVKQGAVEGLVPSTARRLADGEHLAILGASSKPVTLELSGRHAGKPWRRQIEVPANTSGESAHQMLPSFWARTRIEEMLSVNAPRPDVVSLSLEFGVMSPYTSYLVLENQEAYDRYKIERRKEQERVAEQAAPTKNLEKSEGDLKDLLGDESAGESDGDEKRQELATLEEKEVTLDEAKPMVEKVESNDRPDMRREMAEPMMKTDAKKKSKRRRPRVYGHLVFEEFTASAGCDADQVFPFMRHEANALTRCFDRALRSDKELTGRARFQWKVEPESSAITDVRVDRKLVKDGHVTACMSEVIARSPRFPNTSKTRCEYSQKMSFFNVRSTEEIARANDALLARLVKKKSWPLHERVRVVFLHLEADREKEATAWARKMLEMYPEDALDLLWYVQRDGFLLDEYIAFARANMGAFLERPEHLSKLLRALGDQQKHEVFIELFASKALSAEVAPKVFSEFLQVNVPALAKVWEPWSKNYDAATLLTHLNALDSRLAARVPGSVTDPYHMELFLELIEAKKLPDSALRPYLELAKSKNREIEAAPQFMAYCEMDAGSRWCVDHGAKFLEGMEDEALVTKLRAQLKKTYQRALAQIRQARGEDMGNIELITQQAKVLELLGRVPAARRVLSEIVEFSPHDYAPRVSYARLLTRRDRVIEGCGQLATAVQLDPKQRDTFREMMTLRREHGDAHAARLRECIVDGVSKLPVKRAISAVLTWEDDSADVDLHIHEANDSQHVYYSASESTHGGLLYYDITDGYGPEIYVLGAGPEGEYHFTLVYYSGGRENLKAKLTILRDAGAPTEVRETFDVVLPSSDSDEEISVTTLTLDASDRSVDGSQVVAPR